MPMTFDNDKLLIYGERHFRPINDGESIEDYRDAVADDAQKRDPTEAHEIRTGKGWDKWTEEEQFDYMNRFIGNPSRTRT